MKQIFISSVQKEFERERAAIKKMIESDPILSPNFKVFVFEIDAPAADKSTQQVYLKEIEKSDIYLLLVGNKYGYCKEGEVSPTEQEFDKAQELGLTKLVFVRGTDNSKRDAREALFLDKVSRERVRVRYQDSDPEQAVGDLLDEVRNSLRDIMLDDGILSDKPFEDQCPVDASLDDIDASRVAWFVERAIRIRKAKYPSNPSVVDVLRSLHLYDAKRNAPTKAGVLLFGRDVQGPFPSSAIKCACYPGTEKRKPNIDMELVEGDLFQMADQAIAFISRHLNHGAGVHRHGAAADDVDEIPNSVIAEAVNNAIAHRNYASIGSIQVEVYSDRVEVISPGRLHRAITVADLYRKHESFATNPRIARAMYQVKYIETIGTGITDLLKECKAKGLREPLLEEVSGRFRIVIWRPSANDQDKIQPPGPVKGLVNVPVNVPINVPIDVPIDVPINVPINETTPGKVLSAIKQSPGINRTQLAKLLKVDVKTISRAIAALSASVEHRGSKKTGGYYLISQ